MMGRRRNAKGFTLVEMLVAMAVMAIVMSLAALEFKYVVYEHLFTESHLSSEQQARVAIAKVTNLTRQASVVDNCNPQPNPSPAVLQPGVDQTLPQIQFTQAASLDPANMGTCQGSNVPTPCYNTVTVYFNITAPAPVGEILEQVTPTSGPPCKGFDYSGMPRVIARNVQAFSVTGVQGISGGLNSGYRVDISIFDYDDYVQDKRAGALYHISSVVSPLLFAVNVGH